MPYCTQSPRTDFLPSCGACPLFEDNMCDAFARAAEGRPPHFLEAREHTALARRIIYRVGGTLDHVPVLCQGWATTAMTLSDGRRQIISILLPGDLMSSVSIFGLHNSCSIEAITDVRYRTYPRADVREALSQKPALLAVISRIWADQANLADQLALDLGRRGAAARVASLILRLSRRLHQRAMMHGQTMDFPLRQHHIADAAGVTVVHVGNVLAEFRRAGLVEINDRTLTITDPAGLRCVVGMP